MKSAQLDLFDGAQSGPSAVILDWHEPFAAKVMSRIYEYDDDRPKPFNINTVTLLPDAALRHARRLLEEN